MTVPRRHPATTAGTARGARRLNREGKAPARLAPARSNSTSTARKRYRMEEESSDQACCQRWAVNRFDQQQQQQQESGNGSDGRAPRDGGSTPGNDYASLSLPFSAFLPGKRPSKRNPLSVFAEVCLEVYEEGLDVQVVTMEADLPCHVRNLRKQGVDMQPGG